MKVATLIRILRNMDQQSDVMLEVSRGGKHPVRYHARDCRRLELIAGGGIPKVIIASE